MYYCVKDEFDRSFSCKRAAIHVKDDDLINLVHKHAAINVSNVPFFDDEEIFAEEDGMFNLDVSSTLSGEYLMIRSETLTNDPE